MEASSFKKYYIELFHFLLGLLNGYLFMVLLGIIAAYTDSLLQIWLVNIYKEHNLELALSFY